ADRVDAGRVRVAVVGVALLDRGDRAADVRLGRPVLRALAVVQVDRDRDGDQNADDHDDHEQFDEGEAVVAADALLPHPAKRLLHGYSCYVRLMGRRSGFVPDRVTTRLAATHSVLAHGKPGESCQLVPPMCW